MCRYLDGDMVLGNLFIKLLENEMEELSFDKLYDFIYYISVELNQQENTLVLVTKNEIMNFAEKYNEFVDIDEDEEKIILKKKEESKQCFINRYKKMGEGYMRIFDFAFKQMVA